MKIEETVLILSGSLPTEIVAETSQNVNTLSLQSLCGPSFLSNIARQFYSLYRELAHCPYCRNTSSSPCKRFLLLLYSDLPLDDASSCVPSAVGATHARVGSSGPALGRAPATYPRLLSIFALPELPGCTFWTADRPMAHAARTQGTWVHGVDEIK